MRWYRYGYSPTYECLYLPSPLLTKEGNGRNTFPRHDKGGEWSTACRRFSLPFVRGGQVG